MTRLLRFLLLLLFALPSAAAAQTGAGVVSGRVLLKDGAPAVGIRVAAVPVDETGVTMYAALAETGSDGAYRLESVPAGRYYIVAGLTDAPTYYPGANGAAEARAINVTAAETVSRIDFTLSQPLALAISGRVVGPPGFTTNSLSLTFQGTNLGQGAVNADGTFRFAGLRPGLYRIGIVSVAGFVSRPLSVEIGGEDIDGVEVLVDRAVMTTLNVVVNGGGLIPRFRIGLAPYRGGQQSAQVLLAGTREARLQLAEGDYRVYWDMLPFGYQIRSIASESADLLVSPLKVTAGEPAPRITITLDVADPPPWVKVRGRLTGIADTNSADLWNVTLAGNLATATTAVQADGSFEFPMVLPGTYTARLSELPAAMSPTPITVQSRDVASLDIPAPPSKAVTVRFTVDQNGKPPRAFALKLNDSPSRLAGNAEPDGTFRISVPVGSNRISISVPGFTVHEARYGAVDVRRQRMDVTASDSTELSVTVAALPEGMPDFRAYLQSLARNLLPEGLAPPALPGSASPIRIGSGVLAANCVSCPHPSNTATTAGISDTVALMVIVGVDGAVRDVRVTRGHQLLQQAAVDAVQQWRYKPVMVNDVAIEVESSVSIVFSGQ